MDIDLTTLADEDLTGLWRDVLREQERRRRLVDAPALAALPTYDPWPTTLPGTAA